MSLKITKTSTRPADANRSRTVARVEGRKETPEEGSAVTFPSPCRSTFGRGGAASLSGLVDFCTSLTACSTLWKWKKDRTEERRSSIFLRMLLSYLGISLPRLASWRVIRYPPPPKAEKRRTT